MTSSTNIANSQGTGIEWYPKGTNAFTAHAALAACVLPAGKRRQPADLSLTDEQRRKKKNDFNRAYMAAKRSAERVNTLSAFNTPITPKTEAGTSAQARAKAGI